MIIRRRGTKKDQQRKFRKYWEKQKKKNPYTGGVEYATWKDLAEACKRRDSYTCVKCGAKGLKAGGDATLHADHIKAKTNGGKDELRNLQTLCKSCHEKKTGRRLA